VTKDEIITGLKAGRNLIIDGGATKEERAMITGLQEEGLVVSEFIQGDQYGAYRITWKESE